MKCMYILPVREVSLCKSLATKNKVILHTVKTLCNKHPLYMEKETQIESDYINPIVIPSQNL